MQGCKLASSAFFPWHANNGTVALKAEAACVSDVTGLRQGDLVLRYTEHEAVHMLPERDVREASRPDPHVVPHSTNQTLAFVVDDCQILCTDCEVAAVRTTSNRVSRALWIS